MKYIYEHSNWTNFTWQDKAINTVFGEVRNLQGKVLGQMSTVGFSVKDEANLETLMTLDVIKSSEIESEKDLTIRNHGYYSQHKKRK